MNLKERASKLKTDIPAVFLAMKNKKTPIIAKIFAGAAVVYALSPIDLIPDFIPVLGYIDDLLILPILISIAVKMIPPEVFSECQSRASDLWKNGKPKKWYFALPIVFFWILIISIVVKAIWF